VEQVSHHPPVTAYTIENKSKGLTLMGHNGQKTSFSCQYFLFDFTIVLYLSLHLAGSVIVKQIGHAVLTIKRPEAPQEEPERYLITLPKLRIDGLWYGSPYIELADSSHIVGEGYITTVEYKGKGYFSGKSHSFRATTVPVPGQGGAGPREVVIEGTWTESSNYIKGGSGLFYEALGVHKELAVPLEWTEELGEYETRKLWNLVAKGIREGDFELASREKSRIENEQRQKRKAEQQAGIQWELKHFEHHANDPTCKCCRAVDFILTRICSDERLGHAVKINPATEEMYTFKANWPSPFGNK